MRAFVYAGDGDSFCVQSGVGNGSDDSSRRRFRADSLLEGLSVYTTIYAYVLCVVHTMSAPYIICHFDLCGIGCRGRRRFARCRFTPQPRAIQSDAMAIAGWFCFLTHSEHDVESSVFSVTFLAIQGKDKALSHARSVQIYPSSNIYIYIICV